MKIKILLALTSLWMLMSCEEEISLSLDAPEDRLVVEGRLEWLKRENLPSHSIILSNMGGYFDNAETPRVTDAQVLVRNETGEEFEFYLTEDEPGTYRNDSLVPVIGQRYTLVIEWRDQVYEAEEEMIAVVPLESVYQRYVEANAFDDAGIKLHIDFTDQAGQENFYFWQVLSNGENTILANPGNSSNVIAKDEFLDGETIEGYIPNEEQLFSPGDSATVRHIGISSDMYDYLYLLMEQTGQSGQFVDIPPAAIRGNIQNMTNPENFALGYFSVTEVDVASIIITEE